MGGGISTAPGPAPGSAHGQDEYARPGTGQLPSATVKDAPVNGSPAAQPDADRRPPNQKKNSPAKTGRWSPATSSGRPAARRRNPHRPSACRINLPAPGPPARAYGASRRCGPSRHRLPGLTRLCSRPGHRAAAAMPARPPRCPARRRGWCCPRPGAAPEEVPCKQLGKRVDGPPRTPRTGRYATVRPRNQRNSEPRRFSDLAHPEDGYQCSATCLTALLITNGDAGLCIRMRRGNSLTSAYQDGSDGAR